MPTLLLLLLLLLLPLLLQLRPGHGCHLMGLQVQCRQSCSKSRGGAARGVGAAPPCLCHTMPR